MTTINVLALRTKHGLTQQELADNTGIPRDRIAKWEKGKGSPKTEDHIRLTEYFHRLDEKKSWENVPRKGGKDEKPPGTIVAEPEHAYGNQAIMNLTESHKVLALATDKQSEANLQQSIANREQAEAIRLLVETNSRLSKKVTEHGPAETYEDVQTRLQVLLEILQEVSSGRRFASLEEIGENYVERIGTLLKEHKKTDMHAERDT